MVTDFMKQGYLTGHIRRMRQHYREARDVVVKAITRHMGDLVDIEVPECGIQLVVHFKQRISDVEVARQARLRGIVVKPVSPLYINVAPRQGLLIGYSGFDLHQLRAATAQLAKVVRAAVKNA